MGFFSEFLFKCNFCHKQEVITSENRDKTVNSSIVPDIVNTEQGYS